MSYSRRPVTQSRRNTPQGSGLPPWLVFLIAIATVFGIYYLYLGMRTFFETGGLGVAQATERAEVVSSATARTRPTQRGGVVLGATLAPTVTPVPECQDFVITAEVAIMRAEASVNAAIVDQLPAGEILCVIERQEVGEWGWYLIDTNRRTSRIDPAYMREDVIQAVNPTLTPSITWTPAPTVTDLPSATFTYTPEPSLTPTRDPRASDTPTPSPTPTPTPVLQSA